MVLLVHAGGFVIGSPELMDRAARAARRRGFRPVKVAYELGDLSGAVDDVVAAARRASRGGPVYAYGESAGGTLVSRLAQRGLVRSAVANSPIADLRTWPPSQTMLDEGMATARELVAHSPITHRSRRPVLAIAPRDDSVVDPARTATWARRDPRVGMRSVAGEHITGPGYASTLRMALRRLSDEARRRGARVRAAAAPRQRGGRTAWPSA